MTRERIGFGAFFTSPPGMESPAEFARQIEELGFDGFWCGEVPTNRGPSLDAYATLCYAAAVTKRITVGPDVLLLPLHHPVWVAKQYASLDVLSSGRVILAVGVGGEYPKQFEAFGVPVRERGRRTDEGIEAIRRLWTEESADHSGSAFSFSGISIEPKPRQRPHPPIWIGGRPGGTETGPDGIPRRKSKTGAIRRAAKYGDGWNPYYMSPEMYRESVEGVKSYASELGRDVSGMTWALTANWLIGSSYEEALHLAAKRLRYGRDLSDRVGRYDILGSPRDIVRRLETYVDAGVRYFICNWSCPKEDIPWHLQVIAEEIMPHFR